MKLGWLTDPHLNFTEPSQRKALWEQARSWQLDAALVTGDIGEAPSVEGYLEEMAQALQVPIYFVLGNHDFYRGTIEDVRASMSEFVHGQDELFWMNQQSVCSLGHGVALVGHDGWGDGRAGDVMRTPIMLSDFMLIGELAGLGRAARRDRLAALGDEAAAHLREVVPEALADHQHVIVLTHVPPFVESAWHEGNVSDEDWSPFFVCQALGEGLVEIMKEHPDKQLTVLCGHTHSAGTYWPLPNVHVLTGEAVYRKPAWQAPLLMR